MIHLDAEAEVAQEAIIDAEIESSQITQLDRQVSLLETDREG